MTSGPYKVVVSGAGVDWNEPAVVWRLDEAACDAWIASRVAVEGKVAAMDYDVVGPCAGVSLDVHVVDVALPAGEGRIVESFARKSEALEWKRLRVKEEMLARRRGHYVIASDSATLEGALVRDSSDPAEVVRVARGDGHPAMPPSAKLLPYTVPRIVTGDFGVACVRVRPDGFVSVSVGSKAECDVPVLPRRLEWRTPRSTGARPRSGDLSFVAVGFLEGDVLVPVTCDHELTVDGNPVRGDVWTESATDAWNVAASATRAVFAAFPDERQDALGRLLDRKVSALRARVERAEREIADAERRLAADRAALHDAIRDASVEPAEGPRP